MPKVTLKGSPVSIYGELPEKGSDAPDFVLTNTELEDVNLSDFKGKNLILNIFPSIDTGTCAASVRRFNKEAAGINNALVLCVSEDLPFAQSRFCGAEGIKNVIMLSTLRTRDFGTDYGIKITSGPLAGLLARCVVIIDRNKKVAYSQIVPEISEEPDYEKALAAAKAL